MGLYLAPLTSCYTTGMRAPDADKGTHRSAPSTRGRGEVNSFNVIRIEPTKIEVDRYGWDAVHGKFELLATEKFLRSGNIWTEHTDGLMAAGI